MNDFDFLNGVPKIGRGGFLTTDYTDDTDSPASPFHEIRVIRGPFSAQIDFRYTLLMDWQRPSSSASASLPCLSQGREVLRA
jgi:hypothetical protein